MGGAVSAGENNDDLIDNLIDSNYIVSKEIEEIFRAVDRGNYYLPEYRDSAYHDLAWRHEHLHISAPCIYSKVLSALELKPGLSFLNIGSGTGYLSTMVGLALGITGINHGIELHQDVVEYAQQKVQEFVLEARSFDRYTFCEPQFVTGNCLHISPENPGYDRIYCGAACPTEYESFMKNLLNVNGLLVMPLNDQLQVIRRTAVANWETNNILVVNFATLIVPGKDELAEVTILPSRSPLPLCSLCRACIRKVLSLKFHSGSNRRYKKKEQCSSRGDDEVRWTIRRSGRDAPFLIFPEIERSARRSRPFHDSETDSDREFIQRNDDSNSQPRRCSSILNVLSGTVTTVVETRPHSAQNNDDPTSSSSRHHLAPSDEAVRSDIDHDQPSTSKSPKKKNRKKKNPGGTETNGKAKRAKRGWALIRQRFRKRFGDKTKSECPTIDPTPAAPAARSQFENCSDEDPGISQNPETRSKSDDIIQEDFSSAILVSPRSENSDQETTVVENAADEQSTASSGTSYNPRSAVRSLLFSMTSHPNRGSDDEFERRFHRNLVTFFNARRSIRQTRAASNVNDSTSEDSDHDAKEKKEMEEIAPPPNLFQNAILELPLPLPLKRFLLFYRTPN